MAIKIDGTDNYGKPRQDFAERISAMDAACFIQEAEDRIWLSAYAANNPRSDYHWQATACYNEAQARGKPTLYETAWKRASRRH